MDDQLKDDMTGQRSGVDQRHPIDPLRCVFVPKQGITADGRHVFATHDHMLYVRDSEYGPMRRAISKVKGKAARKADKKARRGAS
jgi:hypothetical protein